MESQQSQPRRDTAPHPDDVARAAELVRAYDGDQTDGPCIDVCGYFLHPQGGPRGRIIEGLRDAIAKALSSTRRG